jgi:pimeloyl-ACP methyl ester carboxylesterase
MSGRAASPRPSSLLGWAISAWRDAGEVRRAPQPTSASFNADGVKHSALLYAGTLPRPGVLLHTARGPGRHERALAVRLQRAGLTCMLVRYSGRTTGAVAGNEDACRRIDAICRGAFVRLRADRLVVPARNTIFGLSLGGYFAMRLAALTDGPAPAAVAVWYGVYSAALPLLPHITAPLLAVQGGRDAESFVRSARDAARLAPDSVRLLELARAGHQFDLFEPAAAHTRAAWEATTDFLGLDTR